MLIGIIYFYQDKKFGNIINKQCLILFGNLSTFILGMFGITQDGFILKNYGTRFYFEKK